MSWLIVELRRFLRLSGKVRRAGRTFGSCYLLGVLGESLNRRCFVEYEALVSGVSDYLFLPIVGQMQLFS